MAGADDDDGHAHGGAGVLIDGQFTVDDDVGRVGDDVEHRRTLLRLRDQRLDALLAWRRRRSRKSTLMPSKPLRTSLSMPRMPWMSMPPSSVAVTERSWMPRVCATAPTPAVRQPARPDEHQLDRRRALVLRGEDLGMVGVEREFRLVAMLLAPRPKKPFDGGTAVRAVHPFAARAPLESRGLRGLGQRLAGAEQRRDVDAVVHLLVYDRRHRRVLCLPRHCGSVKTIALACVGGTAPAVRACFVCFDQGMAAPTVWRTGMPVGSKPSRQNTLMPR